MDTTPHSLSRIALHLAMLIEMTPREGVAQDLSEFSRNLRDIAVQWSRSFERKGGDRLLSMVAEGISLISDVGCQNMLATLEPGSDLLQTTEYERIRAAVGAAISKHADLQITSSIANFASQYQYKATLRATLIWTVLFALPLLGMIGARSIDEPKQTNKSDYSDRENHSEERAEMDANAAASEKADAEKEKEAAQVAEFAQAISQGLIDGLIKSGVVVKHKSATAPEPTKNTNNLEEKLDALRDKKIIEQESERTPPPSTSQITKQETINPSPSPVLIEERTELKWYLDDGSRGFKTFSRLAILSLVSISGAWGAFLAYHLRFRVRPVPDNTARFPLTCPMMGALFGFIVFLLLASGLIEGRIFPTSVASQWQAMLFVPNAVFCLALWCLIGGFAQDRIVNILKNFSKDLEKQASGKPSKELE